MKLRIGESRIVSTQSSSTIIDDFVLETPTCWCSSKAPLKTLHTSKNLGMKFFTYPNYNTGEARKYEFFVWADILHLLEENIRMRETKVWKMWDDVVVQKEEIRRKQYEVRKMQYEVRKNEDEVRERETTLRVEK